ncbi:MAG: hypothetical protein CMJ83_12645 [Planctomycetes bacterium]|nr:hypothetical protein [Planctomycetota bacterium]
MSSRSAVGSSTGSGPSTPTASSAPPPHRRPRATRSCGECPGFPLRAAVAAGSGHNLALDDNGDVRVWGINNSGELTLNQLPESVVRRPSVTSPRRCRCRIGSSR